MRGDFHRHTEFSWDNGGLRDGSLVDFYRYVLDAATLDFGAVTDHNSGGDYKYWWWLIEKSCDMYQLPRVFNTFYAYERSVWCPGGHRNVFHTTRGVPVVSFFSRKPLSSVPGLELPRHPPGWSKTTLGCSMNRFTKREGFPFLTRPVRVMEAPTGETTIQKSNRSSRSTRALESRSNTSARLGPPERRRIFATFANPGSSGKPIGKAIASGPLPVPIISPPTFPLPWSMPKSPPGRPSSTPSGSDAPTGPPTTSSWRPGWASILWARNSKPARWFP